MDTLVGMFDVPEKFRHRVFRRSEALAAGITARVLEGPQFVRLHDGVYRFRHHEGDHHLAIPGIFLHRTVLMPPRSDVGVTPTAAFVAYCARARVMDAIKVGSWLLHRGLLDLQELSYIFAEQKWRRGRRETEWVVPLLDGRCRSLPEAELLSLVRFCDLPEPAVNQAIDIGGGEEVMPDLWWARWLRALEYEGAHHQEDRGQYVYDIARYRAYRRMDGVDYELVTKEHLRQPRGLMIRIFAMLRDGGYDGPPPEFGEMWMVAYAPLRAVAKAEGVSEPLDPMENSGSLTALAVGRSRLRSRAAWPYAGPC